MIKKNKHIVNFMKFHKKKLCNIIYVFTFINPINSFHFMVFQTILRWKTSTIFVMLSFRDKKQNIFDISINETLLFNRLFDLYKSIK